MQPGQILVWIVILFVWALLSLVGFLMYYKTPKYVAGVSYVEAIGFKTKLARKSERNWDYANKLAGILLAYTSLIGLIVWICLTILNHFLWPHITPWLMLSSVGLLLINTLLIGAYTQNGLKRLEKKEEN